MSREMRAVLVDDEQLARDEMVYLLGQVGGVEVIRVDTRRRAVEALAGLDLPPDAALATLSVLDPAGELRWAS